MTAPTTDQNFVLPSRQLTSAEKHAAYRQATSAIHATLGNETSEEIKMVTVNCLLKTFLPYYYWVGFYRNRGDETLAVGPYQGTLGCLYIAFGRGVCGSVAASGKTKIVEDTHALVQGKEHIACDPNSRSEIVLPVFRPDGSLLAVFDVDSTLAGSFDAIDQQYLETLLRDLFSN